MRQCLHIFEWLRNDVTRLSDLWQLILLSCFDGISKKKQWTVSLLEMSMVSRESDCFCRHTEGEPFMSECRADQVFGCGTCFRMQRADGRQERDRRRETSGASQKPRKEGIEDIGIGKLKGRTYGVKGGERRNEKTRSLIEWEWRCWGRGSTIRDAVGKVSFGVLRNRLSRMAYGLVRAKPSVMRVPRLIRWRIEWGNRSSKETLGWGTQTVFDARQESSFPSIQRHCSMKNILESWNLPFSSQS